MAANLLSKAKIEKKAGKKNEVECTTNILFCQQSTNTVIISLSMLKDNNMAVRKDWSSFKHNKAVSAIVTHRLFTVYYLQYIHSHECIICFDDNPMRYLWLTSFKGPGSTASQPFYLNSLNMQV